MTSKSLPILEASSSPPRHTLDARALAGGQRLVDEGRVDEALRLLAPLAADPVTPVRAHAALLYAGLLLMTGRAKDAVGALDLVPATPGFPLDEGYRWMLTACALRTARRYDDALAAAHRAVDRGATTGRLLVLADAQKHAGQLAAASATLERLLADEPQHPIALAQLAGYRNLAGDDEGGARAFAAFRAVAGADADAARSEAFYFATRGDLSSTVAALGRALALEPAATRGYMDDEVELDRFRDAAAFRAL